MRKIAIVLAALVLLLVGLLAQRLRAQRAQALGPSGGSGEIEGTDVDLSSRATGRIETLHVRKGEKVRKGDLLVSLDCTDQRAALEEAEARLLAARAQAAAAGASTQASRRQREAAQAVGLAARAQAEALASQRDAARRQARRTELLGQEATEASRDQAQSAADQLDHQASAAVAQAQATSEQARAAAAAISASGAQAVAAEAQVKAGEATARRARLLADECLITAPRDAIVDDLPHEAGELVISGQALVKLVDIAVVKAIFYLPNAELSAARPGSRAQVIADAWPGEVFEGTVRTVTTKAEFTPRNIETRSDRDRLVYPVEVWLENGAGKLRPGMPVQVVLPGTER